MAQLVICRLDDELNERLQLRAARRGPSMEELVRDILRDALKEEDVQAGGLGTEIAALFNRVGLDADISELRGVLSIPTVGPGRG